MPIYTISRGEVVMDHLEVTGRPGRGQFITHSQREQEALAGGG
jgi:hypothetical protein